jgi:hypothetical protein
VARKKNFVNLLSFANYARGERLAHSVGHGACPARIGSKGCRPVTLIERETTLIAKRPRDSQWRIETPAELSDGISAGDGNEDQPPMPTLRLP